MEKIDELYTTLSSQTSKSKADLKFLVENKVKELSGLVSEEGAIYIIANELGVKLESKSSSINQSDSSQIEFKKIEEIPYLMT